MVSKTLKLKQFDFMSVSGVAIQLTQIEDEDDSIIYATHFVLWVSSGETQDFPVMIETEIYQDNLDDAINNSIAVANSFSENIMDDIVVFDIEGEMIEEISLSEYFEDECGGCESCDCKKDEE